MKRSLNGKNSSGLKPPKISKVTDVKSDRSEGDKNFKEKRTKFDGVKDKRTKYGASTESKGQAGKKVWNVDKGFKGKGSKFGGPTLNKGEDGKTDWNELKAQKKTLKEQRVKKKKQTFYDTYKDAKKMWERLRCNTCKPEEREDLCQKILISIKGNIKSMVRAHDMARIVQWLLKLGSDDIRQQIFTEISDDIVNLSKGKYTNHAVKSILQHCSPATKKKVVQKCLGNIYSLTCNKISAPLVEEMYKAAGPSERSAMIKEFYGGMAGDMMDLDSVGDEVTSALLSKSSKILSALVDKGHCLESSLVHGVLLDYLNRCRPSDKSDIISSLKPHFKSFISSRDGVKLFATLLWESTAKEKKNIVKEFKTDIKDIALGEHSSISLLLLIDAVDDTVLIKKALVPNLLEHLDIISSDEHGRKVIIYLMVHRDKKYFHPKEIEWLSHLDSSPNVKKDSAQKVKEIQEAVLPPLLDKIIANPNFWFSNSSISMVTLAILLTSSGEARSSAFSSIADYITDIKSEITENKVSCPAVEHPGTHMVLKKIITNDKNLDESETFCQFLIKKLEASVVERWVESNRGCFTLVAILESNIPSIVKKLKKKLLPCSTQLESQSSKGSEVLRKYLST